MLCRKHLLLLIVSSFFWTSILYAQNKQANNWYFGNNAGITFNTPDGSPQAVFDGQIYQEEGCASISDTAGNLLFYTEGSKIWNREHNIMLDGSNLMGHPSSSMSAIIVPWPGNDSLFYVFTVARRAEEDGLRYSVVNMALDSGRGAVTETVNHYLAGPVHEMVTSVQHADGESFWVVSHLWNTNTFISFLVDQDSIHTIPVSCSIGLRHYGWTASITGYMKLSMQGNKLAITQTPNDFIQILDFDNTCAILSNPITIPSFEDQNTYGIEFSPDASSIYVSSWGHNSAGGRNTRLVQYSISSGDSLTIANSEHVLCYENSIYSFGAIQNGPYNAIYITRNFSSYLAQITNPNATGEECGFIDSAVYIDDGTNTHLGRLGLPAFIQSFFNYASFTWEGHCIGDTTFFAITDTASQDSVFWDFGDTTTGILNNSTSFFPYHIYSDTGSFQVSVIGYNNSLNDTTLQEIFIHPLPVPFLPTDTGFCDGYGVDLWPGNFQSYLWQNGSTDTSFYADTTLSVIVEVTDVHGCKATDSTHAVEHSKPEPVVIYHD